MALKLMDEGALQILKTFFDDTPKETKFNVMLFTEPDSLTKNYTAGNFTWPSYAAGGAPPDKFVAATDGGVGMAANLTTAIMNWNSLEWTFTGPLTGGASIKGYVVIGDTSANVLFAELLTTPFKPENNGDKLTIQMNFTMESKY